MRTKTYYDILLGEPEAAAAFLTNREAFEFATCESVKYFFNDIGCADEVCPDCLHIYEEHKCRGCITKFLRLEASQSAIRAVENLD